MSDNQGYDGTDEVVGRGKNGASPVDGMGQLSSRSAKARSAQCRIVAWCGCQAAHTSAAHESVMLGGAARAEHVGHGNAAA